MVRGADDHEAAAGDACARLREGLASVAINGLII
jgi:hypothetical protein